MAAGVEDGPVPDKSAAPLLAPFYARSTLHVARALLGKVLVFGRRRVRITETEAYLGPRDLACHTSRGRTPRTEVMFGPPGHLYVYLIYGMHHCVNVVTGRGEAVLLRAAAPLAGLAEGIRLDGPGRLCRALAIDRTHNGRCLVEGTRFYIEDDGFPVGRIRRTPRIGVDYAGDWASKPYRFLLFAPRLAGAPTARVAQAR